MFGAWKSLSHKSSDHPKPNHASIGSKVFAFLYPKPRGGRHGQKEVLGLWVAQTEGAKFWLQVLTELQNRGVKDIFIACADGLKPHFSMITLGTSVS